MPRRPATREYLDLRRERTRQRRARIDAIKLEVGCVDCGYRDHPAALHFDHRDGVEKCFEMSTAVNRAWALVEVEMAKCDVRCANCHAIRTAENYQGGKPLHRVNR